MVRLRRSRWLHAHYGMGLAANRPTSYRTKGPCCFRNPPSTALSLGPRCLHHARSLAFLSWKGRTRCHMSVSPREPRVRILLAPAGSPRLFPPLPMPRSEARFMKTPSGYLERAATREPRSRSRRNRPHGRAAISTDSPESGYLLRPSYTVYFAVLLGHARSLRSFLCWANEPCAGDH